MDVRSVVKRLPVLQALPEATQDSLVRDGRVNTFESGASVWTRGEPAGQYTFLVHGQIRLGHRGGLIAMVEVPGELVCGAVVCAALPYCCNAVCTHTTTVLTLPPAAIASGGTAPDLVLRQVAGRAVKLCRRLREVGGTTPVDQRVAAVLLRLVDERGIGAGESVRLPKAIGRRDLAGLVGCATETLIRVLARFEALGLLERTPNGIVVASQPLFTWLREHDDVGP